MPCIWPITTVHVLQVIATQQSVMHEETPILDQAQHFEKCTPKSRKVSQNASKLVLCYAATLLKKR